jgi:hypothetical protein
VQDCMASTGKGQTLPEEADGTTSQEAAQPSLGSGLCYSPIILTSTRFRRRPSRLAGQPFRLASKDLLPRAQVEPPVGDRHDDLATHHAQLGELRPASDGRLRCPCTPSRTGLAGVVVAVLADRLVWGLA